MKLILFTALTISAFILLIAWKNNRRATRTDRKIDRKAKEAERKRQDQIFEMNQRNIQLRKFRKA